MIGYELYAYVGVKLAGFSTVDREFVNQLILTSDYSNNPSISAETNTHIQLNQLSISRENPKR